MTREEARKVLNRLPINYIGLKAEEANRIDEAVSMAMSALAQTNNEPLTLDGLRGMEGEPVWIAEIKHWALIDIKKGGQWDGIPFAFWAENGAKFSYNIKDRNLHCYRRPPEGEADA